MNKNEQRSLKQIISSRRTIKPEFYTSQPVSQDVLDNLLEAACWAPNHGRTEPWRFFIFRGEGREKLKSLIMEAAIPEKKKIKWSDSCIKAPLIIAVALKRTEGGKISRDEELMAVSCAVQNLLLVAEESGLCTYWSTGLSPLPDTASKLGLEGEEDEFIGFIHLGYPEEGLRERSGVRQLSPQQVTTYI